MSARTAKRNKAPQIRHEPASRSVDDTAHLSVRIPKALRSQVEQRAQKERRSMTGQVTVLIEAGLRHTA